MDTKKFLLASLGVFVVYSGLGFGIHEMALRADYEPLIGAVIRGEDELNQRLFLLYLGNLVFALAFTFVYAKGYEAGKSWVGQGLRFGLIVGTLLAPMALTQYVVYPVGGALAVKWILFGYVQIIACALAAAGVYRP
jgi:hypothetical protein